MMRNCPGRRDSKDFTWRRLALEQGQCGCKNSKSVGNCELCFRRDETGHILGAMTWIYWGQRFGQLPADVRLRRVPVALRDEPFTAHQRLYYTLEAMEQLPALHRKVFQAIHVERRALDSAADIAAFAARQGLDGARFAEIYASPPVQARVQRARQLSAAYKIDGVPALGVQGRYFSSAALAGSPARLLVVGEHLIGLARKG